MYEIKSYFKNIDYSGSLYDAADWLNGTSFKFDEIGQQGKPIIKIRELKHGKRRLIIYLVG